MNMKTAFELAIRKGGYDLAGMLERLSNCYAQGDLTSEEWAALTDEARDKAKAAVDPAEEIPLIWAAIRAIQARLDSPHYGGEEEERELNAPETPGEEAPEEPGEDAPGETPEEEAAQTDEAEEWPQYKQPILLRDAYYNGDKITYMGRKYVCVAEKGEAVTWSPLIAPKCWEAVEA